jgi:hypothetical protein
MVMETVSTGKMSLGIQISSAAHEFTTDAFAPWPDRAFKVVGGQKRAAK